MTAEGQKLRLLDPELDELILWIYLDREADGRYGGEIREATYGSESQTGGATIAEAVEEALSWAGVEGFSAPPEYDTNQIREALRRAASEADFDLDVRLYTSS